MLKLCYLPEMGALILTPKPTLTCSFATQNADSQHNSCVCVCECECVCVCCKLALLPKVSSALIQWQTSLDLIVFCTRSIFFVNHRLNGNGTFTSPKLNVKFIVYSDTHNKYSISIKHPRRIGANKSQPKYKALPHKLPKKLIFCSKNIFYCLNK